jgi:phage terminase small subunit
MTTEVVTPTKKKPRGKPLPVGMRKINGARTDDGVTVVQEAYCRARAMGMSIQEAVTAIGSKIVVETARDWERVNPSVRNRLNELTKIATQNAILSTGLNREWVIQRLMTVADRCMQAEPVLNKQGEPTGEYTFDASGANQALRMLGDTLGLFKPAEKKPEDDYASLSDEEIARIAAELAHQTGLLEFKKPDDVIDVA